MKNVVELAFKTTKDAIENSKKKISDFTPETLEGYVLGILKKRKLDPKYQKAALKEVMGLLYGSETPVRDHTTTKVKKEKTPRKSIFGKIVKLT